MKVLVVSDTHGALEKMQAVIKKERPDLVWHLGDIGFEEAWLPSVVYVRGNNDHDANQSFSFSQSSSQMKKEVIWSLE